jgi:hypothetical protein
MKKLRFSSLRSTRLATSSRRHALRRRPAIESLEGRQLLSGTTFYVDNTSDSAVQSLRWAITNSNNTPSTPSNPNVINFSELANIAQIELQSPLPAITQPLIIDGTTEGSYDGAHPFVQLIGNYAGGPAIGLDITASGTQVKGLAIDGFNAGGVLIDNASNVTLTNDWVGIDPNANASGADANGNTIYEGNGTYGVTIQSENGGTSGGDLLSNDIVSANSYNGIILSGPGTVQDVVSGTIIGSDNTGAAVVDDPGNLLGNGQHGGGGSGIVINGGASLNTIGGTTASARDVILGNKSYGVYITGSSTNSNTIEGDVIGTDITGLHGNDGAGASYGNGLSGVAIDSGAAGNLVTGTPSAPEVISNNGGDGVLISGSNYNDIFGVDIGTDINGAKALPNAGDGVAVNSGASGNYVGFVGFSPNIISGNAGNGVSLTGTFTNGNAVVNDRIGLAAGGNSALGNGGDGVLISGQSSSNFIGYASSGYNNVISGNKTWGVYISDPNTDNNTVENNYIGTNAAGTAAVPNADNGLDIVNSAAGNTVGGTTSAARNVISGNSNEGVLIGLAANKNVVEGNYIGTDYTGTVAVPNVLDGVYVGLGAVNNTIGMPSATSYAEYNVISGNGTNGILVTDSGTSGTTIAGNFIGTNAGGTAAVPNKNDGVLVRAGTSGTTIGAGAASGVNLNFISGNAANGIEVDAGGTGIYFTSVGTDVTGQKAIGNGGNGLLVNGVAGTNLQLDAFANNAGYGVLTTNGATSNSFRDSDIYNNALGGILEQGNASLQPAPQLTSATSVNGETTITGTIFGSPSKSTELSLDFFASPYSSSAASIQGKTYIGEMNVTTDVNGNANFTVTIPAAVPAGQIVTATSSLGLYATSQFSNAVTVPATVTSTATFLGTDATTEGSWRNAYGADGYDIAADTSGTDPSLPSYAALSITGATTYTWASSTTATNALENAANTGRTATCWYTTTTMSFNLDITGGAHEVSLYAVDFVNRDRSEQVQVLDAATGTVLSSETLTSFQNGAYLSWELSGNVVIKVTNLNPSANAVVSGIFFGGAPTTATFLGTDTTTGGSWRGTYGANGYDIAADTSGKDPSLPSYAALSITGATTYTWASSTTATNALENAANTGRTATCWYTTTTMSFNLDFTDGLTHKVSLYAVDFVNRDRSEQVQVIDNATGQVLNSETLSSFQNGEYLTWNISGSVTIKVTNLNPSANAVVSGIFFD